MQRPATSPCAAPRHSRWCSATPIPRAWPSTARLARFRAEAAKAISRAPPSTRPRHDAAMAELIQPVTGMTGVLADHAPYWERLESVAHELFASYGYRRVRLPVIERT